jgi:hypothetical protein
MRILQYLVLITGILSISAAPNVEVIRAIPSEERLISVEDAREIDLNMHPNHIHLLRSNLAS